MPYCNRKVLVCGAGGFIGSHLVRRLKCEGFWVRGVDIKYPEFRSTAADEFIKGYLKFVAPRSLELMTFTNSPRTWGELGTYSPESTTRRSCTDRR